MDNTEKKNSISSQVIEICIKVGILAILASWCFIIVSPFLMPIIWGVIIAVASYPIFVRWQSMLGGRPKIAAFSLTFFALLLLLIPTVNLSAGLFNSAQIIAANLQGESPLQLLQPNEGIKQLPLVGDALYQTWVTASQNMRSTIAHVTPMLKSTGQWILGSLGSFGSSLLQFIIAIILAGFLLAQAESGINLARLFSKKVADDKGDHYIAMAGDTIQSVTLGILGVAIIQSLLAALGFVIMDIPAAGLLALLVLFFSVIQIGPMIILAPVAIYTFMHVSTVPGVIFAIWCLVVGLLDNAMKPILLSRGVDVPMPVIFIGAIGGFLSMGIIGLFVGAVVLTVSYSLFEAWLKNQAGTDKDITASDHPD